MPRNINRRVEVLFPVQDRRIIHYLRDEVLATYLVANQKVRLLQADASYEYIEPAPGEKLANVQDFLIQSRQ